jgi:hypothetical protein
MRDQSQLGKRKAKHSDRFNFGDCLLDLDILHPETVLLMHSPPPLRIEGSSRPYQTRL